MQPVDMIFFCLLLFQTNTLEVGVAQRFEQGSEWTINVSENDYVAFRLTQAGCDVLTHIKLNDDEHRQDGQQGRWGVEDSHFICGADGRLTVVIEVQDIQEDGHYLIELLAHEAAETNHQKKVQLQNDMNEALEAHTLGEKQSLDFAKQRFLAAIVLAEDLGQEAELALALNSVGHIHMLAGEIDKADEYYRRALELWSVIGNDWGLGMSTNNRAHLVGLKGESEKSLALFQEALIHRKRAHDGHGVAVTLNNMAVEYAKLGDYRRSVALFEQSVILPEVDDLLKARIWTNIGFVRQALGENDDAVEAYRQALHVQEKIGDGQGLATTLNNLGVVYRSQGQSKRAFATFDRALQQFRRQGDRRGEGHALVNLGVLHAQNDQLIEAENHHRLAADILDEVGEATAQVDALANLGRTLAKSGKLAEGQIVFARARSVAEASNYKTGICKVSLLEARGYSERQDWTNAVLRFDEARQLAIELGLRALELESIHGMSSLFYAQGQKEQALKWSLQSVDLLDDLRIEFEQGNARTSYLANQSAVYDQVMLSVDALPEHRRATKRFELIERMHARTLADVLREGRNITPAHVPPELMRQATQLRDTIRITQRRLTTAKDAEQHTHLQATITETMDALERTQLQIRQVSKSYASTYDPDSTELAKLDFLGDHTAVLAYYIAEPMSYLVVKTGQKTVEYPIAGLTELRERANRLQPLLRHQVGRQLPRLQRLLHEWYQAVLLPAAADLVGVEKLVFVLDGPLWDVPPACWVTSDNGQQNKYLVDDFEALIVPSVKSWLMVKNRSKHIAAQPDLLALAHPFDDENRSSLPALRNEMGPLPFSRDEVTALVTLYQGQNVIGLSGSNATETALKMHAPLADRIHLASHAWLDNDQIRLSGVLLAADESNDGLLQIYEIMGMPLQTRCVVLSACNTGRGTNFWGEGVVGFAHAFLYAGAQSLVLSWWPIQDESTSVFMTRFHHDMLAGRSPSNALRSTALWMKEQPRYQHPFYWAAFMAIGSASDN